MISLFALGIGTPQVSDPPLRVLINLARFVGSSTLVTRLPPSPCLRQYIRPSLGEEEES